MTTIQQLNKYREALEKWKKNKGPEGQGGAWIPSQRKYEAANKPNPQDFNLSGYLTAFAEKIEKQVMEAK